MSGGPELLSVVEAIGGRRDCVVREPGGQPAVERSLALPHDLRRFYELCGGMVLFPEGALPWRVVPPGEFGPAARRFLAARDADQVLAGARDVAGTTFVFADQGEMPIIARSVAEALVWLLETRGQGAEAALAQRPPLGDAYD